MSLAIAQGGLPCAASRPAVRRGSRVVVSQSQKQQPHSTACEASKGGVHSGVVSVKQALLAASASVPGVWAAAAFAAENDAATDALRPLDYLILAIPMVAYGLFYVYREQKDPRVYKKSPLETLVAKPPVPAAAPVKKAAPPPPLPPPPPPPVYSGPVMPIKTGLDAFNIVRDVVVEQLRVEPASLSEKTSLLADYQITTEDAFDMATGMYNRAGLKWKETDAQSMRMKLFHDSILEISHVLADAAGVERLAAWPGTATTGGSGGDSIDFV